MNVHHIHQEFGKVSKVLRSCETYGQFIVAKKMIKLLAKKYESMLTRANDCLGTKVTPFGNAIFAMEESCENSLRKFKL